MTALEKQLVAAIFYSFPDLFTIGRHVGNIGFGMPGYPVEIAKLAVGDANIRGIDIAVDLPGNFSVGDLFFRNSSATYIRSVSGACSKRNIPSSILRKSKRSALSYR